MIIRPARVTLGVPALLIDLSEIIPQIFCQQRAVGPAEKPQVHFHGYDAR